MSKIVIAGASGFIGKELTSYFENLGMEVIPLSRQNGPFYWNPAKNELDPRLLEDALALINLAGENIASGLWTKKKKKRILDSRVLASQLIQKTITSMEKPPKILINASAVGYYGNHREEWVDEDSVAGQSFLSDVCKQWEMTVLPLETSPLRLVFLRLGVVLSPKGGMLKQMLGIFKLGLGGVLGRGDQCMSWIALPELCEIISFILANEQLSGPVNAVSPFPVTNKEFTQLIGKHLSRPTFFRVSACILKLFPGKMAEGLFLSNLKVYPKKLLSSGYVFKYPSINDIINT